MHLPVLHCLLLSSVSPPRPAPPAVSLTLKALLVAPRAVASVPFLAALFPTCAQIFLEDQVSFPSPGCLLMLHMLMASVVKVAPPGWLPHGPSVPPPPTFSLHCGSGSGRLGGAGVSFCNSPWGHTDLTCWNKWGWACEPQWENEHLC